MMDRGSGNILNISSMNAYTPLTKIPAYSGAKAAVSNFTQWLATYFACSGIRVNAIAPGFLVSNEAFPVEGPKGCKVIDQVRDALSAATRR